MTGFGPDGEVTWGRGNVCVCVSPAEKAGLNVRSHYFEHL